MVDSTRQSHCECITPYRGIPSETRKRGKKLGGVPDTYEFNLPDEHKTHRSVAAREVSDVGLGLDAKKKKYGYLQGKTPRANQQDKLTRILACLQRSSSVFNELEQLLDGGSYSGGGTRAGAWWPRLCFWLSPRFRSPCADEQGISCSVQRLD